MAKNTQKVQGTQVSDVATQQADIAAQQMQAVSDVALHAIAAAEVAAQQMPVAPQQVAVQQKKWPKAGGKCWLVWQHCQQLADSGTLPNVAMLRAWAIANGQNVSNAQQEFYAWRKFTAAAK